MVPAGRVSAPFPSARIAISIPDGMPTEPGLRGLGGRGLHAIWCAASVMPVSLGLGTANNASKAICTWRGNAAEDERMNRSELSHRTRPVAAARATIVWWMVGTALNQVGAKSDSQSKNAVARKPGHRPPNRRCKRLPEHWPSVREYETAA